jgi:hypothetical protein
MNSESPPSQPSRLARSLRLSLLLAGFTVMTAAVVAPDVTPAQAQAATSGKANATQLARSADRAIGYLVKAARDSSDPRLSPSAASAKPFWASVKRLNQAVDKLGRGLQLRLRRWLLRRHRRDGLRLGDHRGGGRPG